MDDVNLKQKLINNAYRYMTENSEKEGLVRVLEECTKLFSLSAAGILVPGAKPFVLEVKSLYESEPFFSKMKIELPFDELSDWGASRSFAVNVRYVCCDDVSLKNENAETGLIATQYGVKAYLGSYIIKNYDYMGSLLFVHADGPYRWTDTEKECIVELADLLYSPLLKMKKQDVMRMLLNDTRKEAGEAKGIKDRFLSNISHEIRTPLNSIVGMTTIMKHNTEDSAMLLQCIEKIDRSSKQMLDMFNECIGITLFDEKNSVLKNSWFSIEELVHDIRRYINPLLERKGHHFTADYPRQNQVYGDFDKLLKVLSNVLNNACRFTKENGDISLRVECMATHKRKYIYKFIIVDNGIGMDESFVKILFEPFSKEITSISEANNGNGLGMTVAKHLVDVMHGEMSVSSARDAGTSVTIEVPLECETDRKNQEITIGGSGNAITEQEFTETYIGRRLLIAEDNPLMAEILVEMLGSRGIEADLAGNGREAVELYMKHNNFYYDMILMDLQMPVMDGYEAAELIRKSDKADSKLVPIAALSAENLNAAIEKSYSAGMNVHLSKPVNESELMQTISKYVL